MHGHEEVLRQCRKAAARAANLVLEIECNTIGTGFAKCSGGRGGRIPRIELRNAGRGIDESLVILIGQIAAPKRDVESALAVLRAAGAAEITDVYVRERCIATRRSHCESRPTR